MMLWGLGLRPQISLAHDSLSIIYVLGDTKPLSSVLVVFISGRVSAFKKVVFCLSCTRPIMARADLQPDGKFKIWFVSKYEFDRLSDSDVSKKYLLPCGKCPSCRLEYAKQWAVRCMQEARLWEENYFLTLTYDDDHVPFGCDSNGEVRCLTLKPDDLQRFLKRLRKRYSDDGHVGIRFYACGEYGSRTFRPHYHLIVFNLPVRDKVVHSSNFRGDKVYRSDLLASIWQQGHVLLGEVNFDTCSYVARYMQKKQHGDDAAAQRAIGMVPEFTRMSLRPAIGRAAFDNGYQKMYDLDKVITHKGDSVVTVRPPRYYDKLFEAMHPEQMALVKDARKARAAANKEVMLLQTDLSEASYNALVEEMLDRRIRALKRSL